ncbi:unnamed protein product [Orchesella dallaii]|uniref:Uncharacterized protein n=1 Tax=Orchesella dallaii TaxID=48710 RepID=A0ABP1PK89_9HEXA
MSSPKSPYVSNNGLYVTARTNQSVSLAWPVEEMVIVTVVVIPDEPESSSKKSKTAKSKKAAEPPVTITKEKVIRVQNGNWGYGNKLTVDGLSPDSVLVFHMKRNKETEWGTQVVASTEPTPASTEDLNKAVEMNSEYLVSRILGNSKPINLRKILVAHDRYGMTPLMVACHNGNVGIAKKLLEVGCDVNGFSSGGRRTPLMFACITGMKTIVNLLDEHGADWKIRDKCGCNAMDYAINSGNLALVKLAYSRLGPQSVHIRDEMTGWTPLMRAGEFRLKILIYFKFY